MGDTPTSPGKDFALATPFPGFPRSDVLACDRPSLVRYYALTEQAPLNLNTYSLLDMDGRECLKQLFDVSCQEVDFNIDGIAGWRFSKCNALLPLRRQRGRCRPQLGHFRQR